ncbi:MAG: hypothetical protein HYY24_09905 [Verrucomicrobia bacterium]|nr:hypothetical protein [Verrucomicrobiota bacterium]
MIERIRKRLSNGFHPFTIRLSNGQRFLVPQRDFIAFSAKVVVVIDQEDISHTINPRHIVSVEEAVLQS